MWDQTRRHKITFFVLLITSLVLGWFAHNQTRFPGDLQISTLLQSSQSRPLLAAMESISWVTANWRGMLIVVIAAFIFWRNIGLLEGGLILVTGVFTAANEILKIIVNRPRPAIDLVTVFQVETEKSFPSGHSVFAVAVLGFIAYLIASHQLKKSSKVLTIAIWTVFAVWLGVSRIYLGVHWASDVIGGYVVGATFLVLEIWLYKRLKLLHYSNN